MQKTADATRWGRAAKASGCRILSTQASNSIDIDLGRCTSTDRYICSTVMLRHLLLLVQVSVRAAPRRAVDARDAPAEHLHAGAVPQRPALGRVAVCGRRHQLPARGRTNQRRTQRSRQQQQRWCGGKRNCARQSGAHSGVHSGAACWQRTSVQASGMQAFILSKDFS